MNNTSKDRRIGGAGVALHPKGCATRNPPQTPYVAQRLRNPCATPTGKYQDALSRIPAPGTGCHPYLLTVANLGSLVGIPPSSIIEDIRTAIPHGTRRISDREISDAIRKAGNTTFKPSGAPYKPRPVFDWVKYRGRLIERSRGVTEADIWEASSIRIDWEPGVRDALAILDCLFKDADILFIGDVYDKPVATAAQHRRMFAAGTIPPHVIPNPVDGDMHTTSAGTLSKRCDAAVKSYRFAVVEFDDLPMPDQVCFWHSVIRDNLLPVACLIDSGGKSIHAWLRVDLPNVDAWNREIRQGLYDPDTGRMAAMGADRACQNPSRLSRMPGHFREDNGRHQRVLFINPHHRHSNTQVYQSPNKIQ